MYTITIDSSTYSLSKEDIGKLDIVANGNMLHLLQDNQSWEAELIDICMDTKHLELQIGDKRYSVKIEDQLDSLIDKLGFTSEANLVIKDIKAPMPGLVLEILAKEGDQVEKDTQLLILEAMKMENVIKSPGEGIIKEIAVKQGDAVEKNQLLIALE